MICSACGHESESSAKFCSECGARLGLSCPSCGAPVKENAKFCSECGAAMKVAAASSPERVSVSSEKKQITVLFADVAGSMDLQERLDAEVWAQIMGRFVSILAEGVRRFGGTVDKFTGDGIMALFGAPVAQEDHARRACHAAWHLTKNIGEYSEDLRGQHGIELQVRLGLNSGEVVVGWVGDDLRLDPTALGHTVGLAQRMEAMAEPGEAYVTEHTARLVDGWFELRDLGPMAVKGSQKPLRVYAVGLALSRSAGRSRGASPLVGRERELAVLEDALAMAIEGQGQVVGIVGEAGVGKSRLCDEFAASAATRGITVRRTAGLSHAGDAPLLPVLALLRDYFGINEADGEEEARAKISTRVLGLDPELEESLPLLFDFLEVPDPTRTAPQLAPEVRMRRLLGTIRRLTARRSERGVLVLVCEDLHWFDPQSEAFLEQLIESFPGSRTLVVANFRPGFSARWMHHSYYRQLPLAPLRDEAVGDLLAGLIGTDVSLAPLVGFVHERTGGNPFFVEEVVRSLVEDGTLVGHPAGYRLVRPLYEVRVPPSVQAVVAARIDRLAPEPRRILQTASVIGRTFLNAVLARVTGLADEELEEHLRTLCAAELLQESEGDGVTEYRFWHPLTHEVAYGSLLGDRRARLHQATARAIIEVDRDRLNERAALVASHFERAGDHLECARWNATAATWALRSDLNEALRRWRAVVAHLSVASETDETLRLGICARARLLQFGARTGIEPDDSNRLFHEGRALAERLGDVVQLASVMWPFGTVMFLSGDLIGALEHFLEAIRLAEQADDAELRTALCVAPALIYGCIGPLAEGLRFADRAIALSEGDPDRGVQYIAFSPLVRAFLQRADLLGLMGRLVEARQNAQRAVDLARERSEPELLAWTLSIYPGLARLAGDPGPAVAHGKEAVRISDELGNSFTRALALQALGIAELSRGQFEAASIAFDDALVEARDRNVARFQEASLLSHVARARLGLKDELAARRVADEAVAVARRQGARVVECFARLTRAQVRRTTGGDHDAIVADLDAALALVQETGAVTFKPFIHEELGHLRDDEAELREALRLYRQIGATGHARRLEAELRVRMTR